MNHALLVVCALVLVAEGFSLVRWHRSMARLERLSRGWDRVNRDLDAFDRRLRD